MFRSCVLHNGYDCAQIFEKKTQSLKEYEENSLKIIQFPTVSLLRLDTALVLACFCQWSLYARLFSNTDWYGGKWSKAATPSVKTRQRK